MQACRGTENPLKLAIKVVQENTEVSVGNRTKTQGYATKRKTPLYQRGRHVAHFSVAPPARQYLRKKNEKIEDIDRAATEYH